MVRTAKTEAGLTYVVPPFTGRTPETEAGWIYVVPSPLIVRTAGTGRMNRFYHLSQLEHQRQRQDGPIVGPLSWLEQQRQR